MKSYIRNTPSELFKIIAFYRQFGSGKTSFFEYHKKTAVSKEGMYQLYLSPRLYIYG